MSDRQSGHACALNLILDVFREAAWQPGLKSPRRDAANAIKNNNAPSAVKALLAPFIRCLEAAPLPSAPFDSALSGDLSPNIGDAVSIVIDEFQGFIRGAGPRNWTWGEIADDSEKRVQ